jgi:hypothetical protein
MSTLRHPTGFTVHFDSHALAAAETADGYAFTPVDAATQRSPVRVAMQWHEGTNPSGTWPKERTVDGRRIGYRIDTRGGGSAGDLMVLTAWAPCGAGHLVVTEEVQAETPDEADFSRAWMLLDAASCS